MATGLIYASGATFVIRLLDAATATNSPPATYAGAGIDIGTILDQRYGAMGWPSSCGLLVTTSAGSATIAATVKLWAGVLGVGASGAGVYVSASPGTSTLSGVLNGGASFDEHATDIIHRLDIIQLPRLAQKMYAEVTAISGTNTAVCCDLVFGAVVS
jgi:hypothetical protein